MERKDLYKQQRIVDRQKHTTYYRNLKKAERKEIRMNNFFNSHAIENGENTNALSLNATSTPYLYKNGKSNSIACHKQRNNILKDQSNVQQNIDILSPEICTNKRSNGLEASLNLNQASVALESAMATKPTFEYSSFLGNTVPTVCSPKELNRKQNYLQRYVQWRANKRPKKMESEKKPIFYTTVSQGNAQKDVSTKKPLENKRRRSIYTVIQTPPLKAVRQNEAATYVPSRSSSALPHTPWVGPVQFQSSTLSSKKALTAKPLCITKSAPSKAALTKTSIANAGLTDLTQTKTPSKKPTRAEPDVAPLSLVQKITIDDKSVPKKEFGSLGVPPSVGGAVAKAKAALAKKKISKSMRSPPSSSANHASAIVDKKKVADAKLIFSPKHSHLSIKMKPARSKVNSKLAIAQLSNKLNKKDINEIAKITKISSNTQNKSLLSKAIASTGQKPKNTEKKNELTELCRKVRPIERLPKKTSVKHAILQKKDDKNDKCYDGNEKVADHEEMPKTPKCNFRFLVNISSGKLNTPSPVSAKLSKRSSSMQILNGNYSGKLSNADGTPKQRKSTVLSDSKQQKYEFVTASPLIKETEEKTFSNTGDTPPRQEAKAKPVNYVSPYVTISRGKVSLQKEHIRRNSVYLQDANTISTPPRAPSEVNAIKNLTPMLDNNELTIEARRALEAVRYYRKELNDEIQRLQSLCDKWEEYKHKNSEALRGEDMIDATTGQTKLLINKKFMQFKGLIDRCEAYAKGTAPPDDGSEATKPIGAVDLEGFWSMIYLQVENVDKRFENLERWKVNQWQDPDEMPENQKIVKKVPKTQKATTTRPTANKRTNSALQQLMRKKAAELREQKTAGTANANDDNVAIENYVKTLPSREKEVTSQRRPQQNRAQVSIIVKDRKFMSKSPTILRYSSPLTSASPSAIAAENKRRSRRLTVSDKQVPHTNHTDTISNDLHRNVNGCASTENVAVIVSAKKSKKHEDKPRGEKIGKAKQAPEIVRSKKNEEKTAKLNMLTPERKIKLNVNDELQTPLNSNKENLLKSVSRSILKTPGTMNKQRKSVVFNESLSVKKFRFINYYKSCEGDSTDPNDSFNEVHQVRMDDLDKIKNEIRSSKQMYEKSSEQDYLNESRPSYRLRNRKVTLRPSDEIIIP